MGLTIGAVSVPTWSAQDHALIFGVSQYRDGDVDPLPGVKHDMQSAREMARAMGVPDRNIVTIVDQRVTKSSVIEALQRLTANVEIDSRVFVYFSGHGTRWFDESSGACTEGYLTYDRQVLVNRELASFIDTMSKKADKIVTMIDACYSGGVVPKSLGTRGPSNSLRVKFFGKDLAADERCRKAVNVRAPSLGHSSTRFGQFRENVVYISTARPDESSFDEPERGGIGTQAIRDCMFGKAKDQDASGSVNLSEIEHCAQEIVDERIRLHTQYLPPHVTVAGFRNLVPVRVSNTQAATGTAPPLSENDQAAREREKQQLLKEQEMQRREAEEKERLLARDRERREREALAQRERERDEALRLAKQKEDEERAAREAREREEAAKERQRLDAQAREREERLRLERDEVERLRAVRELMAEEERRKAQAEAAKIDRERQQGGGLPPSPAVASIATLNDVYSQRIDSRVLGVRTDRPRVRIGKDELQFTVSSPRDGYLYIVMLGSDEKSFYLLYPNALERDNRVRANVDKTVPGSGWSIAASGPAGVNRLLFMVADSPRDLSVLGATQSSSGSPFTYAFANLKGRGAIARYLLNARGRAPAAFSAAMLAIEETE